MDNREDDLTQRVRDALDATGQWVREQAAARRRAAEIAANKVGFDVTSPPVAPTTPSTMWLAVRMRPDYRPRVVGQVTRRDQEEASKPVTLLPLEGQSYVMLGPDGNEVLTLPPELVQRYHDNPALGKVRLRLRIVEQTAEAVRLVVDVLPGPTKEKMTLTLDFGGEVRTFEVPPHTGTPRQLTSTPCEALPRSALGLDESSKELHEWTGSVSMRRSA